MVFYFTLNSKLGKITTPIIWSSRFYGKRRNRTKLRSVTINPRLRERMLSDNSNLFCGKLYKYGRILHKVDINWLVKTTCPITQISAESNSLCRTLTPDWLKLQQLIFSHYQLNMEPNNPREIWSDKGLTLEILVHNKLTNWWRSFNQTVYHKIYKRWVFCGNNTLIKKGLYNGTPLLILELSKFQQSYLFTRH